MFFLAACASLPTTPLSRAASDGNVAEVERLIANGADVNEGMERWTPLHHAAYRGHLAVAEQLITHGANVDAEDYKHRTPLSLAARQGKLAMARLLITNGADPNAKDKNGWTPLHHATRPRHYHLAVADVLIDNGATRSLAPPIQSSYTHPNTHPHLHH